MNKVSLRAPSHLPGSDIDWSKIRGFNHVRSPEYLALYVEAAHEKKLDGEVAVARRAKKPLIATECCRGDLDDKRRVEASRYGLAQLKKRGIGWTAYLLHHSLIADAHRSEFGPVGAPGNLAFIEADGSLRPGHELFNEF